MRLTDDEKRMLNGADGPAKRLAMDLLVRYGEALGAERFVDTSNVAGVPGQANPFLWRHFKDAPGGHDELFSRYDLDADEVAPIPRAIAGSCCLQGGLDPENWRLLGASEEAFAGSDAGEKYASAHGVEVMRTCTPYIAGAAPERGEHCAWMESSAVIYCNGWLGAKTNTEGRESTSAAMLTGKIPYWGLHIDENRLGTRHVDVRVDTKSVRDWGMLGYFVGEVVSEDIPVLTGAISRPDVVRLKHFGAAAASSGGVEMYHLVGHTPEAPTIEAAFGARTPREPIVYDARERRRIYDTLNAVGSSPDVDFVMLGCPHAALEQLEQAAALLEGARISENVTLWIFTSRAVRAEAMTRGYVQAIQRAGGAVLTDTCSAIGQAVPPGAKVVALDSAKQTHYLPAIMGLEAWFGTTEECIRAALTGRWEGEPP